jgi:hypothetical protein
MNNVEDIAPGTTSPARPVPARRSRHLWAALAGVAVSLASISTAAAVGPTPIPEPGDPTPAVCVQLTTLASFASSGGPFQGGTTLSWSAKKGCPEVTIRLFNATVPASGAQLVDPNVGTEYLLTASMGTVSKTLGSQVVLGGDVISWWKTPRFGLVAYTNHSLPAPSEAARITAEVTGRMTPAAKRKFIGREIEVHLIPWNSLVTELPYFRHLSGQAQTRGVELSGLVAPNIYAVAVGEETLVPHPNRVSDNVYGFNLAHELGHLVLDFAFPAEMPAVTAAHAAVKADPDHDWFGRSDYPHIENSAHEYFAEATAAFFSYEKEAATVGYYTPHQLAEDDPAIFEILRRQFPGLA